jgi:Zn-dependent M28 family amino/carboxypeptidase
LLKKTLSKKIKKENEKEGASGNASNSRPLAEQAQVLSSNPSTGIK